VLGVLIAAAMLGLPACGGHRDHPVVIGVPDATTTTAAPGPTLIADPTTAGPRPRSTGVARGGVVGGLAPADGHPWPPAIPFVSSEAVPDHLVFILVVGSDARPREDLRHSHGDSLHLLAVNPQSLEGTVLGIPRDSYVEIPGHGRGKINEALARGGPNLLAATVRKLTGLPVDYYVLTGFSGIQSILDDLGGVDVFVDRRMNDKFSGARFEPGWHHFNGGQALAYSRDRHDVENGDFTRSLHQGQLIRSALAKMRAEVGNDDGVGQWVRVMLRHVELDAPVSRLVNLGALARRLDVTRVRNVVAPGRIGDANGASVVYLGAEAARMFDDLRADAVIGGPSAPPETTTTTTEPPTTTTTLTPTTLLTPTTTI
jgi:LCP family protein required for cell wall assembly